MKAWITFEKKPRLRHIGHLDLMRAMQRALRKSDLPICFSKGFNPHLQLTFAAPLSVGMYGLREVMEVPLEGDVTAEEVMDKLSRALPPELPCVSVRMVDDKHPAPMARRRPRLSGSVRNHCPAQNQEGRSPLRYPPDDL